MSEAIPKPKILFDFHEEETAPAPSPDVRVFEIPNTAGDRIKFVTLDPASCKDKITGKICPGFLNYGDCIHLNRARLKHAIEESKYLKTRYSRRSEAVFNSVEMLMARTVWSKKRPSFEIDYIASLFLTLLLAECGPNGKGEGQGTADIIHEAVGDMWVMESGAIIGAAVKILQTMKLIESVDIVKSQRKERHSGYCTLWRITDKGKDVARGHMT